MDNVSYVLGQFVAMGELLLRWGGTDAEKEAFYTSTHLDNFLADLDKNLPLYLEFIDKKTKTAKEAEAQHLISVMNQLYNLISYQSFRDFPLEKEAFMDGYESQMMKYKKD